MALPTQMIGGLVSGFDTASIIEQLMTIERRPITNLENKIVELEGKQEGYTTLNRMVLGFKSQIEILGQTATYNKKTATSSNESILTATAYETAAVGSYSFRVARTAQTHQVISSGLDSDKDIPVGAGEIRIDQSGASLRHKTKMEALNGNTGFHRGGIEITDRSGNSAVVDLSMAETIQDVIDAINSQSAIDVDARVDSGGDGLFLEDLTGAAASTLKVEEVAGGTTAQDLGIYTGAAGALDGFGFPDTVIDGSAIYSIGGQTALSFLRDGLGVDDGDLGTIRITDTVTATDYDIDLTDAHTVQDVLDAIAADTGGVITGAISGRGLELTHTGGNTFDVLDDPADAEDTTATDLGIAGSSAGATLTGGDLIGGLNTVMLDTLTGANGGALVALGLLDITDRAGTAMTTDLGTAATLQDVVDTINADAGLAGVQVTASINDNGDGITLEDTSGGAGNLTIANNGGNSTATDLGIEVDAAVDTMNGGPARRGGISLGDIRIGDRDGGPQALIALAGARTLQEVVDRINTGVAGVADVEVELNQAGNGLVVRDLSGGAGNLLVEDVSGSAAADLGIAVDAAVSEHNGGDLDRHYVSRATKLADLNRGNGVYEGSIRITDANGSSAVGNLSGLKTVGEVMTAINNAGLALRAEINTTGDGITLINTTGSGTVKVEEEGGGTTAKDLGLLGSASDGNALDGSFETVITVDANDNLRDVVMKVGLSDAAVTASVFNDGSGHNAYHMSVTSDDAGLAGMLVMDSDIAGLSFADASRAQDAAMLYGAPSAGVSPVLVTNSSNNFTALIPGLNVSVQNANINEVVTVTVGRDTEGIVTAAEAMVEAYNNLNDVVQILTRYDTNNEAPGLLFGDSTVSNLMREITDLMLTSVEGLDGGITGWYDIGLQFKYDYLENDEGDEELKSYLELDSSTLSQALSNNFESVQALMIQSTDMARADRNASVSVTNGPGGGTDAANLLNGNTSSSDFGADNGYAGTAPVDGDQITVQLDKARPIYQLALHHIDSADMPADEYAISDFTVEYFNTLKQSWETARTFSGNQSALNYISLPSNVMVDQIRLTVDGTNAPDDIARLVEIEAFESEGVASKLRSSLKSLTDTRSGVFATAEQTLDSKIDDLESTIEQMESRMEKKEISLLREFAAMEQALAQMQQQSDFFMSQMSALQGGEG